MNLRKTLLAGALTLGLIGSIAAPAAIAQETPLSGDTATISVEITGGGEFFAYFCDTDELGSSVNPTGIVQTYGLSQTTPLTASTAATANGTIAICYSDDINYRGGFNTILGASDFDNITDTSKPAIDKSNLSVVYTHNVGSVLWMGANRAGIGFFGNDAYLNIVNIQSGPGYAWTANANFSQARTVQFGWNGVGTYFSVGEIDLKLTIPAGTASGDYQSELTITVMPNGRTKSQ